MRAGDLTEWSKERGYRIAWGAGSAIRDSLRDLADRRRDGEIHGALDRTYLVPLEEVLPATDRIPPWVIVILVPRPAHWVTFAVPGKTLRALIPPTYVQYRTVRSQVIEDLGASHFGVGVSLEPLASLHKAVAARLGLVHYGRNNVTYAEGFGSYFQIVACTTSEDLSEGAVRPGPPALLPRCTGCEACEDACPTGAIESGRFLLKAERCLVHFNERGEPFPGWVPPEAHRCLIGCMTCQTECPENAGKLSVVDTGVVFSEEETRRALLFPQDPEHASLGSASAKLATLGLTEEPAPLWRNLRALFVAKGWPLPPGG